MNVLSRIVAALALSVVFSSSAVATDVMFIFEQMWNSSEPGVSQYTDRDGVRWVRINEGSSLTVRLVESETAPVNISHVIFGAVGEKATGTAHRGHHAHLHVVSAGGEKVVLDVPFKDPGYSEKVEGVTRVITLVAEDNNVLIKDGAKVHYSLEQAPQSYQTAPMTVTRTKPTAIYTPPAVECSDMNDKQFAEAIQEAAGAAVQRYAFETTSANERSQFSKDLLKLSRNSTTLVSYLANSQKRTWEQMEQFRRTYFILGKIDKTLYYKDVPANVSSDGVLIRNLRSFVPCLEMIVGTHCASNVKDAKFEGEFDATDRSCIKFGSK